MAAGTSTPSGAWGPERARPRGGPREPGLLSAGFLTWIPAAPLLRREGETPWLTPRLGLPLSLPKISLSRPAKLGWVTQRQAGLPIAAAPWAGLWARPGVGPPHTHTRRDPTAAESTPPPPRTAREAPPPPSPLSFCSHCLACCFLTPVKREICHQKSPPLSGS